MGSIFGFGGSSGGGSTNNSSEISGLSTNASYQDQLANQVNNQGQTIYGTALNQYQQGASGQLSPSQQALVTENLGTMDTGTSATYANMGLGGSTMEGQDLASNQLKSEAESANISFQNEAEGLSGLSTADNYYNTANNALTGSSASLKDAGSLASSNLSSLNSAISSLGNKSSSSSTGGLFSGLGSLFGGSSGAGTASAVDTTSAFV